MSKSKYCLFVLCVVFQPAMATKTDNNYDFWKNCPGRACPANEPNGGTGGGSQQKEDRYKHLDERQLEKERNFHKNKIKEIQREEKQRYER